MPVVALACCFCPDTLSGEVRFKGAVNIPMEFKTKNATYQVQVGFGPRLTKGVVGLGLAFIITFLITQADPAFFFPLLGFVPFYAIKKLFLWQFVTANFLHADLYHLGFNLLALALLGASVEKATGTREFLKFFFICGIGGYILTAILWLLGIIQNGLAVGASAGIFGILLAFSIFCGEQSLLLFFVIPLKAKWLALIMGCLELLLLFKSGGASQIGHLGGLLTGAGYLISTKGLDFIKGALRV